METMFITPIQPISIGEDTGSVQKVSGQSAISGFKGIFEEAVNNVRTTEEDLVGKQYLLATGHIEDAHSVMIASSQAQLAVDMLVSLRNKALEAYNEVMRISI